MPSVQKTQYQSYCAAGRVLHPVSMIDQERHSLLQQVNSAQAPELWSPLCLETSPTEACTEADEFLGSRGGGSWRATRGGWPCSGLLYPQ